ncbi:MAG: PP2C family protein-serine/threonine phosphatase [Bacteroidota bacterium]
MQLRKLYRTVETIASKKFPSDEELLTHALLEIVNLEEIKIKGGRIWKFDTRTGSYVLLHQIGEIEHIKQNYRLRVKDNPIFLELPRLRTILASEQDQYLRRRGIFKFTATGVGEKIHWRGKTLFKYVLAFNADQLDGDIMATFNIISSALTSALRTRKIEEKAQVLERDLDKAREIQKSILPQHELRYHSYEIYGVSLADRIVGGDFFDYLKSEEDNDRVGIVIGDATSKGVSAAVEALYVSGALRMGFEFQTKISSLLGRVNKLVNKAFSDEYFVSLFYCELINDKNGLVIFANCGHNNPILFRLNDSTCELLETTGQVLGPFPEATFKTENFLMKQGDILLLYTDGVTEARDEAGNFFGENRLNDLLINYKDLSSRDIALQILQEVQVFSAGADYSDDKTLVVIKRTGV